ncbi:hypothetical protein M885DRAFT_513272 [Pelagophyceae sp. CCMP2097]|nr:hypothetical protein M885DRAFT_513272 [Pelagophyceae sp. CCMP2097]
MSRATDDDEEWEWEGEVLMALDAADADAADEDFVGEDFIATQQGAEAQEAMLRKLRAATAGLAPRAATPPARSATPHPRSAAPPARSAAPVAGAHVPPAAQPFEKVFKVDAVSYVVRDGMMTRVADRVGAEAKKAEESDDDELTVGTFTADLHASPSVPRRTLDVLRMGFSGRLEKIKKQREARAAALEQVRQDNADAAAAAPPAVDHAYSTIFGAAPDSRAVAGVYQPRLATAGLNYVGGNDDSAPELIEVHREHRKSAHRLARKNQQVKKAMLDIIAADELNRGARESSLVADAVSLRDRRIRCASLLQSITRARIVQKLLAPVRTVLLQERRAVVVQAWARRMLARKAVRTRRMQRGAVAKIGASFKRQFVVVCLQSCARGGLALRRLRRLKAIFDDLMRDQIKLFLKQEMKNMRAIVKREARDVRGAAYKNDGDGPAVFSSISVSRRLTGDGDDGDGAQTFSGASAVSAASPLPAQRQPRRGRKYDTVINLCQVPCAPRAPPTDDARRLRSRQRPRTSLRPPRPARRRDDDESTAYTTAYTAAPPPVTVPAPNDFTAEDSVCSVACSTFSVAGRGRAQRTGARFTGDTESYSVGPATYRSRRETRRKPDPADFETLTWGGSLAGAAEQASLFFEHRELSPRGSRGGLDDASYVVEVHGRPLASINWLALPAIDDGRGDDCARGGDGACSPGGSIRRRPPRRKPSSAQPLFAQTSFAPAGARTFNGVPPDPAPRPPASAPQTEARAPRLQRPQSVSPRLLRPQTVWRG